MMKRRLATTNTTSAIERCRNQARRRRGRIRTKPGTAASAAFTPSTEPWITVEMPAKNPLPCPLMYSIADAMAAPSGILCAVTQASKPARRLRVGRGIRRACERRGRPVERRHAVEPGPERIRVRLEPFRSRGLGRELALEDAGHHLALGAQRELEVPRPAARRSGIAGGSRRGRWCRPWRRRSWDRSSSRRR